MKRKIDTLAELDRSVSGRKVSLAVADPDTGRAVADIDISHHACRELFKANKDLTGRGLIGDIGPDTDVRRQRLVVSLPSRGRVNAYSPAMG